MLADDTAETTMLANESMPLYDFGNGTTIASETTNFTNGTDGIQTPSKVVLVVGYTTVMLLALIGNSFVIAVVFKFNHMHSVTNYFLVNLAVADILMSLFCLPFTLAYSIIEGRAWIFGEAMCKAVPFLQGTFVAASVYTLAIIALDRYLAICHTFNCRITKKVALFIIPMIWIMSALATSPALYAFQQVTDEESGLLVCNEGGWNETSRKAYRVAGTFFICYLIPLVFISINYALIGVRICRREALGEQNSTAVIQQKSKTKVLKMLIAIVLLFAFLWLPLYVMLMFYDFGTRTDLLFQVMPYATLCGTMTCCVNPIIYCAFSRKYREAFKLLLTCQSRLNNNVSNRSLARNGHSLPHKVSAHKMEQRKKLLKRLSGNSFDSCQVIRVS